MIEISPFFFGLFASVALIFSLMVVLKKNPVASAFSLILVFFCFAALYALLDAHLVAVLQVLVYAGAIMVLFIFVIMLLNVDSPSFDLRRSSVLTRGVSAFMALGVFGLLVMAFKQSSNEVTGVVFPAMGPYTTQTIQDAGGNVRVIARLIFSEYLLPFELTSILLLVAIVGTVALSKRKLLQNRVKQLRGMS